MEYWYWLHVAIINAACLVILYTLGAIRSNHNTGELLYSIGNLCIAIYPLLYFEHFEPL